MTVKELKEILSKYDNNTEIFIDTFIDDPYETDNIWVTKVREPMEINNEKYVKEDKIAQRPCKQTSGARKCLIL